MKIAVPADFSMDSLMAIHRFNLRSRPNRIFEVYGSLPFSGFAAGRSAHSLPACSKNEFEAYVQHANEYGITFNYTLNGTCLGAQEYDPAWRSRLRSHVHYLRDLGIDTYTICTPAMVAIVRNLVPQAHITVSVTAEVASLRVASVYETIGVDKIMASLSLYRNFSRLRALAQGTTARIGVILNSFCFPHCAYRSEHFNTSAHLDQDSPVLYDTAGSFDFNQCALEKLSDPSDFLCTAFIRPEDIHFYEDMGVSFFKLEGRQRTNFDAVKVAGIYSERRFDGNICDLHVLFSDARLPRLINIDNRKLDGFLARFAAGASCDLKACPDCEHCRKYAQDAISVLDAEGLRHATDDLKREIAEFTDHKEGPVIE